MNAPRLEIDLDKIEHNARVLRTRLEHRGMSVTGVTKATPGSSEIAAALLKAGVNGLADSRIENIESLRRANIPGLMTLIRTPMLSQVSQVVEFADVSFNTELNVLRSLSAAAMKAGRSHGIVLMIELGDLREGIMPADLEQTVRETLRLPNIDLCGLGTNLACRFGVSPDAKNMSELSTLATATERTFGLTLDIVSGGNSANLNWALSGNNVGRINNLRLGESILLGREPLQRQAIDGLHTDAITLVAEVIESGTKPSIPWGTIGQGAFGHSTPSTDRGQVFQAILALGHQDTDPFGLHPPRGIEIVGASSDHLILNSTAGQLSVGTEISIEPNYSALVRAMTSPFVRQVTRRENQAAHPTNRRRAHPGQPGAIEVNRRPDPTPHP